ncbi:MAG: DUF4032 domain-containing protein [Elusimicrobia bacterium]|nr:DUF4032 domain-containing protein [Elusimicrobiota bacterium]
MPEQKDTLIEFSSIEKNLEHAHQLNKGVLAIPIDKIVGSLGRYTDFNEEFLLHKDRVSAKYESVRQLMMVGKILPPIKVYKVLDNYFVIDGHHRVTVAKNEMGAAEIDAEVIEIQFDLDLSPKKQYSYDTDKAKEFLIKLEENAFEKETFLRNAILAFPLKVTDLTSFGKLFEEINSFRRNYNDGELAKRAVIYSSFAWYEQRFLPAVRIIVHEGVLNVFPRRTYTDLYIWMQQHKYYLSQKAGYDVGFDFTKDDFVQKYRKSKFLDLLPQVVTDIMREIKGNLIKK